jgi:hypothetical protein
MLKFVAGEFYYAILNKFLGKESESDGDNSVESAVNYKAMCS